MEVRRIGPKQKAWRGMQEETANWSIHVPRDAYKRPQGSRFLLGEAIRNVLEASNRPLETKEVLERVIRIRRGPVNSDALRTAIHKMYRQGLLLAVHSCAQVKWQLVASAPSPKTEFVIIEAKHL